MNKSTTCQKKTKGWNSKSTVRNLHWAEFCSSKSTWGCPGATFPATARHAPLRSATCSPRWALNQKISKVRKRNKKICLKKCSQEASQNIWKTCFLQPSALFHLWAYWFAFACNTQGPYGHGRHGKLLNTSAMHWKHKRLWCCIAVSSNWPTKGSTGNLDSYCTYVVKCLNVYWSLLNIRKCA